MHAVKTAPSIFINKHQSKPACKDCKHVNKKLLEGTGLFSCNLLGQKLEVSIIPTTISRMEPFLCGPDGRFYEHKWFKEYFDLK
jgi:hypothetical protein